MTILFAIIALFWGAYQIHPWDIFTTLIGSGKNQANVVILWIRLPRIIAAILVGLSLGISGCAMQGVLRNPLSSPFTLGINQGAAFGAAFAILVLGAATTTTSALRGSADSLLTVNNPYLISLSALLWALFTTSIVLFLAQFRSMRSDAIILAGIALSSLFTSGIILLQYLATDIELAAIVFWSFGDVSRSAWNEILISGIIMGIGSIILLMRRWHLNALAQSDEIALSLGIQPQKTRLLIMLVASILAAIAVAFHGVIAFLGLLAPHIARRFVGEDMRHLMPLSLIIGALLLLMSDTFGRLLIGSGTLPVGVITSFMGAPLFIYLLIRGRQ